LSSNTASAQYPLLLHQSTTIKLIKIGQNWIFLS
jgi:hypothetical protein